MNIRFFIIRPAIGTDIETFAGELVEFLSHHNVEWCAIEFGNITFHISGINATREKIIKTYHDEFERNG